MLPSAGHREFLGGRLGQEIKAVLISAGSFQVQIHTSSLRQRRKPEMPLPPPRRRRAAGPQGWNVKFTFLLNPALGRLKMD